MKHLFVCREYPPPVGGGIASYIETMTQLLAKHGDSVYVITQRFDHEGNIEAERKPDGDQCDIYLDGRLIVYRLPYSDARSEQVCHSQVRDTATRTLFYSDYPPQSFAWQAGLLAERLVEENSIDVIEAQEYEAPLYFFLLRRKLGFGPDKKPPCVVHLHTSTEYVAINNDVDRCLAYYQTAKQLEDFTVEHADALLCPSQFLAKQVEERFGRKIKGVTVIPLPINGFDEQQRTEDVWRNGRVTFIGRPEKRKGIIEWAGAAIAMAQSDASVRFDFIGITGFERNNSHGTVDVKRLIPRILHDRFTFHGVKTRSAIVELLQQSRIAVVPSRWENFPFSCIESMSSGMPVLATKTGGMSEVVQDNETGWLVEQATKEYLCDGLRLALNTPPEKLMEMGENAAKTARKICNPIDVCEQHIRFKQDVIRSVEGQYTTTSFSKNTNLTGKPKGIAFIVMVDKGRESLSSCLRKLEAQASGVNGVSVICTELLKSLTDASLEIIKRNGWSLTLYKGKARSDIKNQCIANFSKQKEPPLGLSCIRDTDFLEPNFTEVTESVLMKQLSVGVVSSWFFLRKRRFQRLVSKFSNKNAHQGAALVCPLSPSFPVQLFNNQASAVSVLRVSALAKMQWNNQCSERYDDWGIINMLLVNDWEAVTLPVPLVVSAPRTPIRVYDQIKMKQWLLASTPSACEKYNIHCSQTIKNGAFRYWLNQQTVRLKRELRMIQIRLLTLYLRRQN